MRSHDPVIGFVIIAIIQFSDDRKVGKMKVVARQFEPHPPVRVAIKLGIAYKGRVPHARSLDRHIGRHNDVSGQFVIPGRHPDDFALFPGLGDAVP